MSTKNQKTLSLIFKSPTPSNIRWRDIERLFISLEAKISEGHGSRVRVKLNKIRAVFHRPHPQPNTDKGAVKSVRKFLEHAGIHYDEV